MTYFFSLTVIYAGLLLKFTFNHFSQDFATTLYFYLYCTLHLVLLILDLFFDHKTMHIAVYISIFGYVFGFQEHGQAPDFLIFSSVHVLNDLWMSLEIVLLFFSAYRGSLN